MSGFVINNSEGIYHDTCDRAKNQGGKVEDNLIGKLLDMREDPGAKDLFVFLVMKDEVCLMSFEKIIRTIERRELREEDVIKIIIADLETSDRILRILISDDPDAADEFVGVLFIFRSHNVTLH